MEAIKNVGLSNIFFVILFQMSKLDISIKEQRSDLKQKTNVLEHSLSQCQFELSEKTLEVTLHIQPDITEEIIQNATRFQTVWLFFSR